MQSCKSENHYHLMIRLLNCSSGKETYVGTIQTDALYAYNNDKTKNMAATVKDIINTWRDRRCFLETDAVATVEWNGTTLDPCMLIRDIVVDGEKIPLHIQLPNNPFILKYWEIKN